MMAPDCNVCGSTRLIPRGEHGLLVCQDCRSRPVTRLLWLILNARGLIAPGKRILHIAPELGIAEQLRAIAGENYEPVDIDPDAYADIAGVRRMDLCVEAPLLASGTYDLIIHSHVMEHVKCSAIAVMLHLHRALKDDGWQVCCVPFVRNRHSSEDLAPIDAEDALHRFGQDDHVRVFGALDIQQTLGMVFTLPGTYDLPGIFGAETLRRHAIPEVAWSGWTPHSVLALAKGDIRVGH